MNRSLLDDAFAHHVWATLQLIDACAPLTEAQLATAAPGTYGSILDTMRHLVGSDASYLRVLTGERSAVLDADGLSLAELRAVMEANGPAWRALVAQDLDADEVVVRHRPDGSESHAARGVRIAQVLHHGTDHRSQICTALTGLGVEPPSIDAWDYARHAGRLTEIKPAT